MKNYYALIHFDGVYVSGFLAIGHEDTEAARLAIIKQLTNEINNLKSKNGYTVETKRLISFRRSFAKPHRKFKRNNRSEHVLEMVEIPSNFIMQAGYWLSLAGEDSSKHICNLPRQKEEHPTKGYLISQLK